MELGECSCVVTGSEVISAEVSHPALLKGQWVGIVYLSEAV